MRERKTANVNKKKKKKIKKLLKKALIEIGTTTAGALLVEWLIRKLL